MRGILFHEALVFWMSKISERFRGVWLSLARIVSCGLTGTHQVPGKVTPDLFKAMENEITIRAYAESDESDVAALWRSVFPDSPSWNVPEDDIARKLTAQRELFLVATLKNKLIGTAMGGYDGHRGWVYYVAVLPEFRRQGIANKMMDEIERLLIEMGCPKINLMVRASNRDVISFYESLGYKVETVRTLSKRLTPQ